MTMAITNTTNLVVDVQVGNDVSIIEVTCVHTMAWIKVQSRKEDEGRQLNVHALPREMGMCVHARNDLYTSTFESENTRDNQDMNSPGWFKDETVHIDFLFLFLPPKKNINDVNRLAGSWNYLGLFMCVRLGATGRGKVTAKEVGTH